MKHLYLVRHAKSSWGDPVLDDFERPLSHRGKNDAPLMGKRLKKYGVMPDVMISSPAKRALKTAKIIAREIGYPEDRIRKEQDIYEADVDALLHVIHSVKDSFDTVMIFGHNPGLNDLSFFLSGHDPENLPTCGIFSVDFDLASWKEVGEHKGIFIFFDYPKKYKKP